jgi:hypothetical protein
MNKPKELKMFKSKRQIHNFITKSLDGMDEKVFDRVFETILTPRDENDAKARLLTITHLKELVQEG